MSLGTNMLAPGGLTAAGPLTKYILADRYKKGQPIPGWDGPTPTGAWWTC